MLTLLFSFIKLLLLTDENWILEMFLIHFDFVVMKLLLKKSGDAFAIIHFKQADYSLNESVSNLSVVQ